LAAGAAFSKSAFEKKITGKSYKICKNISRDILTY
jgi:hypothetical protein